MGKEKDEGRGKEEGSNKANKVKDWEIILEEIEPYIVKRIIFRFLIFLGFCSIHWRENAMLHQWIRVEIRNSDCCWNKFDLSRHLVKAVNKGTGIWHAIEDRESSAWSKSDPAAFREEPSCLSDVWIKISLFFLRKIPWVRLHLILERIESCSRSWNKLF